MRITSLHRSPFHTAVSVLLMITLANLTASCHFYKVKWVKAPLPRETESLVKQAGKYYILHSGDEAWHLSDITVSDEAQTISGSIEALPKSHLVYQSGRDAERRPDPIRGSSLNRSHFRYRVARDTPGYEIHLYTDRAVSATEDVATIPMNAIQRIDVYDKAVGHTTASFILGGLGIVAGAFVIVFVVALLLKSSCPFAYTQDETGAWNFTGELYGGAIYAPLERDDYMPLPGVKAASTVGSIKISNELLERQYTNLARVVAVTHPAGTTVLLDNAGQPQTISTPESPLSVVSGAGADCKASLSAKDGRSYLFDAGNKEDAAVSSATLTFQKPTGVTKGKLVLKAKNSYWLDYAFGKFTECFGTYYNTFAASQKKAPAAELRAWSAAQHIPLSVSVSTPKGWKEVGQFETMGPLASRDLVMPVDLSGIAGESVRIRLQCGFMFWEVDFAAMDFAPNAAVKVEEIAPASATDEQGKDVAALLSKADGEYLVQPSAGNVATLKYSLPSAGKGETRTCFLHSRGYYEYIRDFKKMPDVPQLLSFKKDGAFTRYAKARYDAFVSRKDLYNTAFKN